MFFCPPFLNFKEKRMLSSVLPLSFGLNFNLKKKHLPSAQPDKDFFGSKKFPSPQRHASKEFPVFVFTGES